MCAKKLFVVEGMDSAKVKREKHLCQNYDNSDLWRFTKNSKMLTFHNNRVTHCTADRLYSPEETNNWINKYKSYKELTFAGFLCQPGSV